MPRLPDASITSQPTLCHVEDVVSTSHWNTPFRVKVNISGQAVDATLDTGASLSAVQSVVVQNIPGGGHANKTVVCSSYSACRWSILLPIRYNMVVVGFHGSAFLSSLCCSSESFFSCHSGNGFYVEIFNHTSCTFQDGGTWG